METKWEENEGFVFEAKQNEIQWFWKNFAQKDETFN